MKEFLGKVMLVMAFFVFLCGQNVFAATSPAADVPMGQSAGGEVSLLPEDVGEVPNNDDLFGSEGGYFHPYIMLDLGYTDNLYNLDEDKTSNFLTTASPGVWFALPRKKIIPVSINPHNSSPGGLQSQFEDYEGTDRFQAYALGGVDFNNYSEDTDLNKVNGLAEGMARYNMRGGLSLQIVDRYTHGEDALEVGSSTRDQNRSFDSNFLMATADWSITEKFRIQFDYFNFALGYEDEINYFLDRMDNGLNLYGYFNYSLMTSFFLQYKLVGAEYDESIELDNTSNFIYGGIRWDTTEKISLLAKIGYQMKEFDDESIGQNDYDGFVFDFQVTYRFSEKSLFDFDMYRTNEETDNYLATDKVVLGAAAKYTQKFTEKFSASIDLAYENAEYTSVPGVTKLVRDDDFFTIEPGVQYLFKDWLMFELAYTYANRESTEEFFDYASNTVLFSAAFAL